VDEVVISDLVEGVFFARIRCTNGMQKVEIDARPSDAIAIALRFDAPIFTYETILSEAGIITDDKEEEPEKKTKAEPVSKDMSVAKESKSKPKKGTNMEDFSLEQLQKMLEDALNREDYENAARIRDEMNRRN
jgi:bifunctional DNase/RNase